MFSQTFSIENLYIQLHSEHHDLNIYKNLWTSLHKTVFPLAYLKPLYASWPNQTPGNYSFFFFTVLSTNKSPSLANFISSMPEIYPSTFLWLWFTTKSRPPLTIILNYSNSLITSFTSNQFCKQVDFFEIKN